MIYGYNFSLDIHDVDFNGVARASALMRHMQTAAQNQLTENGMSYDDLKGRNRAFLLSRITIELTAPIYVDDKLRALSFPCESRGFGFLRFHALERNGITVGRALSLWALVDTESRSLVRVNNFNLDISTETLPDIALERFVMPKSLEEVGEYRVTYADTDRNRHLNNTRYPDMYANFLPLENKRIERISISYLNEAPSGDKLSVFRATDADGCYYFRTLRSDGIVNSEAVIRLSEI